jgi:hypothetical protein
MWNETLLTAEIYVHSHILTKAYKLYVVYYKPVYYDVSLYVLAKNILMEKSLYLVLWCPRPAHRHQYSHYSFASNASIFSTLKLNKLSARDNFPEDRAVLDDKVRSAPATSFSKARSFLLV